MTNAIRKDEDGSWHHWTNRGARRQPTFLGDEDRALFLRLLGIVRNRYGIETHAMALMTNHYHALVRSTAGQLSRGVQFLASTYTRDFNRRHGFDGPQCRARFTSVPIQFNSQLIQVSRYIHRNPFDLDPTLRLTDHKWSSFGAYLGHVPGPLWLRQSAVLEFFGDDRSRYRDYVESPQPTDKFTIQLPSVAFDKPVLDDSVFEVPSIAKIEVAVAKALKVSTDRLSSPDSPWFRLGQQLTVHVARTGSYLATAECAAHLGLTVGQVRSTIYRARTLSRRDADFVTTLDRVRRILAAE